MAGAAHSEDLSDLEALTRGDKRAWDRFVTRYSGVIRMATAGILSRQNQPVVDQADLIQDVFVRLCRDDFRLLKTYDPARATLNTWVAVVARSTALDAVRRKAVATAPIDDMAETLAAPPTRDPERLAVPPGLLSPRQEAIMALIYGRDMDPAEIAALLGIDPQTVRSMHHKALTKLRAHFRDPNEAPARTSQG